MNSFIRRSVSTVSFVAAVAAMGWMAYAQDKPVAGDYEKEVKEAEVPKAALEALKKLAGKSPVTEFAEEVEHGRKYYEGTWAGPHGKIDGLVTEAGDLVELEESVPAEAVPAGVKAELSKMAGKDAAPKWEKKTLVMYEAHYQKDGKGHEVLLLADGRVFHEEGGKAEGGKDDDDDEKDEQ